VTMRPLSNQELTILALIDGWTCEPTVLWPEAECCEGVLWTSPDGNEEYYELCSNDQVPEIPEEIAGKLRQRFAYKKSYEKEA